MLDIAFGLSGSILVDYIGVRRVSLVALSVALISRAILALSRTQLLLYVALFVSSFGDALLSIGLVRIHYYVPLIIITFIFISNL